MPVLDFGFLDVLDVLLVAFLLYQIYRLVKGTVAINILLGVASIYLIWKLVEALHMELLSEILGQFIGVGVIALLIVFQQELRKFLLYLGTTNFGRRKRFLNQLNWLKKEEEKLDLNALLQVIYNLAETKTGALLVFARKTQLGFYAQTGDILDAQPSPRLLEAIFQKESPLHDGAVIIQNNRIRAARAILPVSENQEIPARFGLRHRAAVGVTEKTDAVAVVVSEQTGEVTWIQEGALRNRVSRTELEKIMNRELQSR